MTRPSENLTAIVGTVLGAIFIIIGAVRDGIEVALDSTEVHGAVIILVSYTAWAVTAIVRRRQAAGQLGSGPAGEVLPPAPTA